MSPLPGMETAALLVIREAMFNFFLAKKTLRFSQDSIPGLLDASHMPVTFNLDPPKIGSPRNEFF